MRYELFFWAMLAVVASASVGGILLGWVHSIRKTLVGAFILSGLVAGTVVTLHAQSGMEGGLFLSAIASFLFSLVISNAFALLTRRIIQRPGVS